MALGPVWPMIIGIGTSRYRDKSAFIASILYASGGLGGAAIPVLIGWVSGSTGFYGGLWLLVISSIIGLIMTLFLRKRSIP